MENTLSNFNIDDTPSVIKDLMAPETTIADPKEIIQIIEKLPIEKNLETVIEINEKSNINDSSLLIDLLLENEKTEENKITTKDLTESDEAQKNEKINQFTALANDLFKIGIFNKEDDEEINIDSPESFKERFEFEKKNAANEIIENFIGQFGEDYQKAFEAIYQKGVNPKEYFSIYNEVISYAELDMTIEENQIKVVKKTLTDQEYDVDDIDSEIERLQNYGDLETVANKHHKVLIKKDALRLKILEEETEKQNKLKEQNKNLYYNNVNRLLEEKIKSKEFDGIPLTPTIANEIKNYLLVDNWKLTSGETLTDFDKDILDLKKPENHNKKIKIALIIKMLEKDPTLSSIKKSAITQATNSLFSEVVKQTSTKPKEKIEVKWNL